MEDQPTIFALASAQGRAGVAVIRISGPLAFTVACTLTGQTTLNRGMRYVKFYRDTECLDDGMLLAFPAPNSFTGEDVVELQCHGSVAILKALLQTLGEFKGLRLAEAGEFTRRAFENNRLDLTQAEGLAELIDAQTDGQRRAARRQLDGAFGRLCQDWHQRLLHILAMIEATIDFSDEELPEDILATPIQEAKAIIQEIQAQLNGAVQRQRLKKGAVIALVGAPNAGKSTLMNCLAATDIALISDIPGTTRDAISADLVLNDMPITLFDLAGIRETTEDQIEQLGIQRAIEKAKNADLRLFVCAVDSPLPDSAKNLVQTNDLFVWNKADLMAAEAGFSGVSLSALTGEGVTDLITACGERLGGIETAGEALASTMRHVVALETTQQAIAEAIDLLANGMDIAICAETLRGAMLALGRITGKVSTEDLLGVIFSQFCIGK